MKRIIALILVICFAFSACGKENDKKKTSSEEPDITLVRNICEMATIECYFHNVAKGVKKKGKGISHLGEKNRRYWVEYDAVVKIGIDMKDVEMQQRNDGTWVITIPKAKILGEIKVISENDDDVIKEGDSWNDNNISTTDISKTMAISQDEMRENIEADSTYFVQAEDRAKKLIENYMKKINEGTGADVKYVVQIAGENYGATVSTDEAK